MRHIGWAVTGTALMAMVTATGIVVTTQAAMRPAQASPQPPPNTAAVTEGELSAAVSVAGTLTYRAQSDGSPYEVIDRAQGVYTKFPQVGQVVPQGRVLYRVDDKPVVLLRGTTPAYRAMSPGTTGPDVAQLNADLVALGYATPGQLHPQSRLFGPATTAAVRKLQAVIGLAQSGTLALGEAVFEPTALRVTALSAELGASAQTGQVVMQATSTTRQVQVALSPSQQADMAVGDKVSIVLPDNDSTPGVVSSVGTVAACPPTSGPGATTGSPALGTDACSSGGPGSAAPTITVTVTPSDPAATGRWDQAPVRVSITTARVANAMAVPVTALLAQPSGGYAVEVVGAGSARRLVPVSLGLFDDADGLVQVTSAGLSAGQRVVVPAL